MAESAVSHPDATGAPIGRIIHTQVAVGFRCTYVTRRLRLLLFHFKRKQRRKDESESYLEEIKVLAMERLILLSLGEYSCKICIRFFAYRAATPVYAPLGILKLSRPKQPVYASELSYCLVKFFFLNQDLEIMDAIEINFIKL